VRSIERADHCEVEQASGFPIELWTAPDGAPAVLGHEFLERSVEIIGRLERVFHELFAEHGFADFKATVERLLIHDVSSPKGDV
jgi:hypothetical protein